MIGVGKSVITYSKFPRFYIHQSPFSSLFTGNAHGHDKSLFFPLVVECVRVVGVLSFFDVLSVNLLIINGELQLRNNVQANEWVSV